jgi:hypothetical protein
MDRIEAIPRIRTAMISALEDVGLSSEGHVTVQAAPSPNLYEVTVIIEGAEHHELARQTCLHVAQRVKGEVGANIQIMPIEVPGAK